MVASFAICSCDSTTAEDPVAEESYEGDVALDGFVDDAYLAYGRVSQYARITPNIEFAESDDILLDEWIAMGHTFDYSIMLDYTTPFDGKPSFYVEMTDDPLTETDETEGRCELVYCFTTEEEFYANNTSGDTFEQCQLMKTVNHYGHGSLPQGCTSYHRFSVNMPEELDLANLKTIFAQWHGSPDRTLTQSPEGVIKMLTTAEFVELCETTEFVSEIGYDKVSGEPNGWIVEQGGSPPVAFVFDDGYFCVKANSDRKWLSDKDESCSVTILKNEVGVPYVTAYKEAVIAGAIPHEEFPKGCWVTFDVTIKWSEYSGETEVITEDGWIDVWMRYDEGEGEGQQQIHIVDNVTVRVGRNDELGYHFKYGIYRPSGTVEDEEWMTTCYNVAGYSQWFQ